MLSDKQIQEVKKKIGKLDTKMDGMCKIYDICADPTRLKIIFLFSDNEQLCPTDISNVLDLSMSAVSHQVRVLEDAGILNKVKKGKMVCYSLTKDGEKFFKCWIKM